MYDRSDVVQAEGAQDLVVVRDEPPLGVVLEYIHESTITMMVCEWGNESSALMECQYLIIRKGWTNIRSARGLVHTHL